MDETSRPRRSLEDIREPIRRMVRIAELAVLRMPVPQTPARRAADAQRYWSAKDGDRWGSDSHVRGEVPGWEQIGLHHREMYADFARTIGVVPQGARVLEWGAGGGANAVAFAPMAEEFIAVDVSRPSLEECGRQVAAVCDTTYTPVLVGVDSPEDALAEVQSGVDLFLCLYVLEVLPSKGHVQRVMEVAAQLLRPGGSAMVQIKSQTGSLLTWPRTWNYERQVSAMTSFPIHEFWELSGRWGLTPHSVRLVPRNELDERYAYFFLTRS